MWYPTATDVHAIHWQIIETSPVRHDRQGIRSPGAIEHIVAANKPPLLPALQDPMRTAAGLLNDIAHGHPYECGNKRTALATAALTLKQNGFAFQGDPQTTTIYMRQLTRTFPGLTRIAEWLRAHSVSSES